jgi:hypothetical protein
MARKMGNLTMARSIPRPLQSSRKASAKGQPAGSHAAHVSAVFDPVARSPFVPAAPAARIGEGFKKADSVSLRLSLRPCASGRQRSLQRGFGKSHFQGTPMSGNEIFMVSWLAVAALALGGMLWRR